MSSQESVPRKASRRRRAWWLSLIVIAAASIAAVAYVWRQNGPVPAAAPPVDAAPSQPQAAPRDDAWETESFAAAAAAQLSVLGKLLEQPGTFDRAALSPLVAPAFACGTLRPASLVEIFADQSITVSRMDEDARVDDTAEGPEGLAACLEALATPLRGAAEIHVKFKVYGVNAGPQTVTTNVLYQASGRFDGRTVQQTAVWLCRWRPASSAAPRLAQIRAEKFEEVVARAPSGTLFADCTEAVFENEPSFAAQLLPGTDYWRGCIQAQYGVYPYGHHGIAVGDVNGDGLDDLYVCQPEGLPNRLYLQNRDGTVRDVAAAAGVDWLDRSRGVLLIDLDNDGDQDLVAAVNEMIVIMANDDAGSFTEKTSFRPTGDPGSLAAADYDADGDLDVFVASYGQRFLSDDGGEISSPTPYHDANNGGPNMLLRNDGDWTFTDVTRQCGLDTNNRRWSLAAAWADYDGDGDPDLYVANDFGRNNLYRNDRGQFVDVAPQAGVEDIAAGMSVSWGDYNQDGRLDLYVGNMFSSAGLRIAYQDRFQAHAEGRVRAEFQRHARGNSLFVNVGDGTFRDVSEEAAVTRGRWAWDSKFVDVNNDGLEDIIVANGFVTGSDPNDL